MDVILEGKRKRSECKCNAVLHPALFLCTADCAVTMFLPHACRDGLMMYFEWYPTAHGREKWLMSLSSKFIADPPFNPRQMKGTG